MIASDYLTGAGHFGVGFVAGFTLFLFLLVVLRRALWIRLYGPFIPFVLGSLAATPYFFADQVMCDQSFWVYIFFLYPFFHCQPLFVKFFGNIHVVVVACGFLYVFILWYYIRLVKSVRRGGWLGPERLEKPKRKRRRRA
jgi:hypothetical protein